MVCSTGADPNYEGRRNTPVYLRAKGKADAELASGLEYRIVRPGS